MEEEVKSGNSSGSPLSAAFCAAATAVIVMMVLSINGFGPIDDHTFVNSLLQGRNFPTYIIPSLGRFMPATAQEYGVAARIFGPSPFLFHVIGAVKVLLCCGFLLGGLFATRTKGTLVVALWASVVFSVAFANSSMRLQIGELNALILIVVFAITTIYLDRHDRDGPEETLAMLIGLTAFASAFFYKETIFTLAFGFAVSEIFRGFILRSTISLRVFALLTLSILYLAGYEIWHHLRVTGSYLSIFSAQRWTIFVAYARNDPIIVFAILPLIAGRAIACIKNKHAYSVYDSFLLGTLCFFSTYIVLGIFNTYYLLPCYGFAVLGAAGVCRSWLRTKTVVRCAVLYVWVLALNNLPVAISDTQALKEISNNHYTFTRKLANWIWIHSDHGAITRNLVLAGVSPSSGVELTVSLKRFLEFRGLPDSMFKIRAELPTSAAALGVFPELDQNGYMPRIGDIVIYNPYQEYPSRPPLSSPSYAPIYQSETKWAIPPWTAFKWAQTCIFTSQSCYDAIRESMPYTGYDATLLTRPIVDVKTLPLRSFKYEVGPIQLPDRLRTGERRGVDIMVRNTGSEPWPVTEISAGKPVVHMSYVWLDRNGNVALGGERALFPETMQPGDIAEVAIKLNVPTQPGLYKLVFSPVQENVKWFYTDPANASVGKQIEVYGTLGEHIRRAL